MSASKQRGGSRGAAPVSRDPNIEEAQLVGQGATTVQEPTPETDAPMPTVENSAQYKFVPGRTCSILDVQEIGIAFILMLQNNDFSFDKGSLRRLSLPGYAFEKLSDDAQKFFVPLETPDVPAGA